MPHHWVKFTIPAAMSRMLRIVRVIPVGGAEEIVLHPGECFKGFFVVLHLNRIANHKNCPRIL